MKAVYPIGIICGTLIVLTFILFTKPEETRVIPESDVRLLFTHDGCKVYGFKVMEAHIYKDHYFTSCKGSTIDVEDDHKFTQILTEGE